MPPPEPRSPVIELSRDAENSAFAAMMAELIRANLTDHPEKQREFDAMHGRVALIAEDAEQTITLHFRGGSLCVHQGFFGIPDLVIRGPSEALIDLSRLPPHPRMRFLPDFRSDVAQSLARAVYQRKLHIGGLASHLSLAHRLSSVMSIHGEVALDIEHKHPFAHDEAKSRAKALADYLQNKHGMQVRWAGDDAFHLQGKYMVVSIDASVKILADKVHVTGPDPGMLWRSSAKTYIARKLTQYMDPGAPLASLPTA